MNFYKNLDKEISNIEKLIDWAFEQKDPMYLNSIINKIGTKVEDCKGYVKQKEQETE